MLDNTKLNGWALFIIIILLASPILRFSWDFTTQSFIHIFSLAAIIIAINYFEVSLSLNLDLPVLIFFLAAIISLPGTIEIGHVRNGLLVLFDSLVLYFLAGFADSKQRKAIFLVPVMIGLWLSAILFFFFILNPFKFLLEQALPAEFIINPNLVSGYILLSFFLSLAYWRDSQYNRQFTALSIALLLGIFLTRSRTALALAALFGGYFVYKHSRPSFGRLKVLMAFVALALILFSFLKIGTGTFVFDRIVWWKAAWRMFLSHPFKGVGWGNFENYYLFYRPALTINTLFAHNIIFQLLSETGIVGLVSFLLMLYFLLFRNAGISSEDFPGKETAVLCILGFLSFNLFDYGFYVPSHQMLFWTIMGTLQQRRTARRQRALVSPVLAGLLIIALSYPLFSFFLADLRSGKAAQYLYENNLKKAETEIEIAVRLDPSISSYCYKAAQINLKLFSNEKDTVYLDRSIAFQEKALNINPLDARMWSDLSWLYLLKNNPVKAHLSILNAVKCDTLNPNYPKTLVRETRTKNNPKK